MKKTNLILFIIFLLGVIYAGKSYSQTINHMVSGYVVYDKQTFYPVSGVKAYLVNLQQAKLDSSVTDNKGLYSFKNVADGTYKINCSTIRKSGGINVKDAFLILRGVFADDLKARAADVNCDMKKNSTDALIVAKYAVLLINKFPCEGWLFEDVSITVNGADVRQDIKTICVGDVDGSFNP